MNIPSQGLEVVIGVLGAEVPCAQDVLDLARHQQLLELGREAVAAMGDVEVTQHQHQSVPSLIGMKELIAGDEKQGGT